ncbi:MAG: hypothetical protein SGARI_002023 [Bacillariaceae sp.]
MPFQFQPTTTTPATMPFQFQPTTTTPATMPFQFQPTTTPAVASPYLPFGNGAPAPTAPAPTLQVPPAPAPTAPTLQVPPAPAHNDPMDETEAMEEDLMEDPMEEEDLDAAFKIDGVNMTWKSGQVPMLNEAQLKVVADALEKAHLNKTKPPARIRVPNGDGTTTRIGIKSFKYDANAKYRVRVKGKVYVPNGTKPNAYFGLVMYQFGEDRKSMEPSGIIIQVCQEFVSADLRYRLETLAERGVLENVHMIHCVMDEKLAPIKENLAANEQKIGDLHQAAANKFTELDNKNKAQDKESATEKQKVATLESQMATLRSQMAQLLATQQHS